MQGQLDPGLNDVGVQQAAKVRATVPPHLCRSLRPTACQPHLCTLLLLLNAQLAEHFQARQRALLEQQQDHAAPQANGKHPPNGVATIPQQPVSAVWSSDLSRCALDLLARASCVRQNPPRAVRLTATQTLAGRRAAQTAGSVAKALGMQVHRGKQRLGAL